MVCFISVRSEPEKSVPSVFICDGIIRHCKNFVPSHDLAGRGLFFRIIAGLDSQMDKFIIRIPSSARSSSNAFFVMLSFFVLSLSWRSTPNSSSTSTTSIFSSRKYRDRLPHDLLEHVSSTPKLHAYPKDKYNCSFRDLLGQLGCRCMFCFTK